MKTTPAYEAIKRKAEQLGQPKHFRTDLTKHDRLVLCRADAPQVFGWCLRHDGTHIILPPDGHPGQLTAGMCADAFGPDACSFYFWDGVALCACLTAAELDQRLLESTWRPCDDCGRVSPLKDRQSTCRDCRGLVSP